MAAAPKRGVKRDAADREEKEKAKKAKEDAKLRQKNTNQANLAFKIMGTVKMQMEQLCNDKGFKEIAQHIEHDTAPCFASVQKLRVYEKKARKAPEDGLKFTILDLREEVDTAKGLVKHWQAQMRKPPSI